MVSQLYNEKSCRSGDWDHLEGSSMAGMTRGCAQLGLLIRALTCGLSMWLGLSHNMVIEFWGGTWRESKCSSKDQCRSCEITSDLLGDHVVSLCGILSDKEVTKTTLDSREIRLHPLMKVWQVTVQKSMLDGWYFCGLHWKSPPVTCYYPNFADEETETWKV